MYNPYANQNPYETKMDDDPYKILNVSYDASMDDIRSSFKKIVMKVHPDRGGDAEIFNMVKNAYTYLFNLKKTESKVSTNRTYADVKKSRTTDSDTKLQLHKSQVERLTNNGALFNKIYDEHRVKNINDEGYSNYTEEEMDSMTKNNKTMEVFKDPEGINISCTGPCEYEELGKVNNRNFNSSSIKSGYSDFLDAYREKDITTMQNVRVSEYKNVDDLVKQRGNISHEMDETTKQEYARRERRDQKKASLRQFNLHKQDRMANKNFKLLQRSIQYR